MQQIWIYLIFISLSIKKNTDLKENRSATCQICYLPLLFYCFRRKHRYQSRSHYRVIEPNYDRNCCLWNIIQSEQRIARYIPPIITKSDTFLVSHCFVWETNSGVSVISWRSVLLVNETGVPIENHRPVASHWQTLSHTERACVFFIFPTIPPRKLILSTFAPSRKARRKSFIQVNWYFSSAVVSSWKGLSFINSIDMCVFTTI